MTTRSRLDLSTIDPSSLDAESLRLLTAAVEAEAKRLRAEAMRDLLRGVGRFIRQTLSWRPAAPRSPGVLHAHVK
ncbi:MAG: RSP_7527 family protein [Burkholderiales bacterium]